MGSQQKKKKRTEDTRSMTSEIKRTQDLDVNKLALEPSFEIGYSPVGVGTISYVNVSTSIGPAQGGSAPPAQVTGLTVTPQAGSDTQLNLAWTANTDPDFNFYNVYRGTSPGFTVNSSSEIAQPVTNSYNNTGLSTGTTYYYRVSTTNNAQLEGAPSSEISGTTTSPPGLPNVLLHFDNNITDSGSGGLTGWSTSTIVSGFNTSKTFGTHSININTTGTSSTDFVRCLVGGGDPNLFMNTTVGFSISLWVYPIDISALQQRRVIVEHLKDANNKWTIQFDSTGKIFFFVQDGGTDFKREQTGLVVNQWQHIGAVYDAVGGTVRLYKDAVQGANSGATTQYPTDPTSSLNFSFRWNATQTHHYKGRIDEFQFFNGVVLTPVQITNLMNTNTIYPPAPPPQTVGLTATPASESQINLAWNASTATDLSYYNVYRGTSTGFTADSSSRIAQPTSNSYNNTGLIPNTPYYYRVAAVNTGSVEGPLSSQVPATTNADTTAPPQTVNLVATVMSSTQINLAWTASTATDLNHYDVHRSTTSAFTPVPGTKIGTPTSNSFNDTGLTSSTTYYYKVTAVDNATNIGAYSSQISATTSDATPPPQTVNLAATVASDTQINLTWTASTATDLNHYDVHQSTTSGFTPGPTNKIGTPTTNSYNNTGLTPNTPYYYRVAAVDNSTNIGAYSTQVSGTTTDTTAPPQVAGLIASPISTTQINLAWNASTATDLNHYDVHRSTTSNFTPATGNRIAQPTSNSYNNTGLTTNTTYYYKVAAVDNSSNIGGYSTQASATTLSDLDVFGVKKIYPTKSGGTEWFSTAWATGGSRIIPEVNMDTKDTNFAYSDGAPSSNLTITGTTGGVASTSTYTTSNRLYAGGPWKNSETTAYVRIRGTNTIARSDNTGTPPISPGNVTGARNVQLHCRSSHSIAGPTGSKFAIPLCHFGGYSVLWNRDSLKVGVEVEVLDHCLERHLGEQNMTQQIPSGASAPFVGFKVVCRSLTSTAIPANKFANVKVEGWILYDVSNQNGWTKCVEFTFNGTNVTMDAVSPSDANHDIVQCCQSVRAGTPPQGDVASGCTTVSETSRVSDIVCQDIEYHSAWDQAEIMSWIRCDDCDNMDYKFFSVREIDALP